MVNTDVARSADIVLKFSDGSFMGMIFNTNVLPQEELQALSRFLRDASRINPTTIATSSNDPTYRFPALHLVWSNRYAELVSACSSPFQRSCCLRVLTGCQTLKCLLLWTSWTETTSSVSLACTWTFAKTWCLGRTPFKVCRRYFCSSQIA